MTEWKAAEYARISGLQHTMAEEVLSLLDLRGAERVLDVGCGNGRNTSEIAARVPLGAVVGVDSSATMVEFASSQYLSGSHPNLTFAVADARRLPFHQEFDLVVSFNALHWIPEQAQALQSIHSALKRDGRAQLRLVSKGERKSLENVLEETRLSRPWAPYFEGFQDPYLHLTAGEYADLATQNGFQICRQRTAARAWDFESRDAFLAFGAVTFVEWTQHLPENERQGFAADVLDRYRAVAADGPGEENIFRFYQMDILLAPIDRSLPRGLSRLAIAEERGFGTVETIGLGVRL